MSVFREHTPKRRPITTIVSKHGEHRSDLRIDYKNRCGYCNDIESYRITWFEIDHFVPKEYLKTITETDYSNLVFACRSCNNAKRAKWPTKDEKIHHQNDEGFIDPCDDTYNNQFDRLNNGRIVPKTKLGGWIYNSLKLYKPQHEVIWNIELLDTLIEEINAVLEHSPNDNLKERLTLSLLEYRKYVKELGKVGL
ncbi:MAG TPA: HNH endonuclease [Flavobacterium sp.]|nr:HNH endonuclease [Flavobacterium sp.]